MTEPVLENAEGRDDDRIPRVGHIWYCRIHPGDENYFPKGGKIPKIPCGYPNGSFGRKYARKKGEPRWEPKCANCNRKKQMNLTKVSNDRMADLPNGGFSSREAMNRRLRTLRDAWRAQQSGNLNIEDDDEEWFE
ncbi:MAG: hypothetical protein CMB73_05615 [Euryarchaeota archaeon]|nr:hypothetical protein [Euryarchaeota archaeon]